MKTQQTFLDVNINCQPAQQQMEEILNSVTNNNKAQSRATVHNSILT